MAYVNLLWNLYRQKKNAAKTKEQIRALQNEKLRQLLAYAYDHSAYYRRTFQEAKITREQIDDLPLSSFPAIDKTLFFQHFDELITVSDLKQEELRRFDSEENIEQKRFKGKYHVIHSSGSTGKPGYFIYDDDAWNCMLVGIIRAAFWNMSMTRILRFLLSRPRVVYIAATDGRYGGAIAVGDGIEGVHANQLFLDINEPLTEWIEKVERFKPNMIIGYPSAIKILGRLVEEEKVRINALRVVSCGEPLEISMRRYIEKTFDTEVVNLYGASESLALGVETDRDEGMILFDDLNVIEMQGGTIYLTSLYNFAQPVIRYRLSDQFILKEADGNSRCPFTKAAGLLGRDEDLLWFEDIRGNREFLHPLAVEGFCVEGLKDYQFRQIEKDAFEMLAEVPDAASKDGVRTEVLKQMRKILSEKGLHYVHFYVNFVDEIMPDPQTGKKRLIIKTAGKEAHG